MKKITIDPITKLEGHGKITIFLNDDGNVDKAVVQIPELRGFEAFAKGRPADDMPQITSRICGVCPTAHHIASTKALDSLYKVSPPEAAKKIRELIYSAFVMEDHALHFYFMGGTDFLVGPEKPAEDRNIMGVAQALGKDTALKVINMRKKLREMITVVAGKVLHPVLGLPGGVSKAIDASQRDRFIKLSEEAIDFARFTLQIFHEKILQNESNKALLENRAFRHETHYMGLVDDSDQVNFYDGHLRVVSPEGEELFRFSSDDYEDYIAEHVENWTFTKFPYLKKIGWKGFVDGGSSGIFRVAPLARLNAAKGMATEQANDEYLRMYSFLGEKPAHQTLANHWARLIEILYNAERMSELVHSDALYSKDIRNMDFGTPSRGIGIVEAPRGTLIHDYETDDQGLITRCNLIVATVNNSAAISMSVEKAAKEFIRNFKVDDGLLNKVEMAFRAYDPCMACATHTLIGKMPLEVRVLSASGKIITIVGRGDSHG